MSQADDGLGLCSRLVHAGRKRLQGSQPVNPPIVRAATYLHDTVASMQSLEQERAAGGRTSLYGRRGTETAFLLEDLLSEAEGGVGTRLASSGLAANILVFLTFARPGSHVVISDGVYSPVRRFAHKFLTAFGISYTFAAADGYDLRAKMRDTTTLVYWETPGAVLYEIADIREIAEAAASKGTVLAVDNTWASGFQHHPIELGADISIISATKYLSGHSDLLLGAVICNSRCWPQVNEMAEWLGTSAPADDAYQVLRGMRTLGVRLKAHEAQARSLIAWFRNQPFVSSIYYPGCDDHPSYKRWQRDFSGACGLFTVEFREGSEADVEAFVDALQLFGIGSSWGGFESLSRVEARSGLREVSDVPRGPVVRFHAGFEDIDDLIRDLNRASAVFVSHAR